jgi:L-lactate dehydrogenase complex protein LldE
LFPDAGRATVRLLGRLGQPVESPLERKCCGQMHATRGYFEADLVRRYVDTFAEYDAVAVALGLVRREHPSPACVDRALGG